MINEFIEHVKESQEQIDEANWRTMATGAALITALMTGTPNVGNVQAAGLSHVTYQKQDYINAIVGEAENQGYDGMLAIASAIRNRAKQPYYKNNVLHGVFGKGSSRLSKASQEIFNMATKAWGESKTRDTVSGAYIWGNASDVTKFRTQAWFKNVEQTVKIKDHYFFRNKR